MFVVSGFKVEGDEFDLGVGLHPGPLPAKVTQGGTLKCVFMRPFQGWDVNTCIYIHMHMHTRTETYIYIYIL